MLPFRLQSNAENISYEQTAQNSVSEFLIFVVQKGKVYTVSFYFDCQTTVIISCVIFMSHIRVKSRLTCCTHWRWWLSDSHWLGKTSPLNLSPTVTNWHLVSPIRIHISFYSQLVIICIWIWPTIHLELTSIKLKLG